MSTDLYHVVEHGKRYEHDEEYRRRVTDDNDRGCNSERRVDPESDQLRQNIVDSLYILREPVQDPAGRCRLEERHWRSENVLQHFKVHDARRSHAADGHVDGIDEYEDSCNGAHIVNYHLL